jgi:hypothetical protein
MRPIDFCHLNELRAPAPLAFPARCRGLHRVGASRTLGSVRLDRGPRWFTPPETASADRREPRSLEPRPRHRCRLRAWVFYSHGALLDRTSDIPVASLSSGRRLRLRALAADREGAAETAVTTAREKTMARDDPGCLPSAGTLRRIRWPLQPRSRDRRDAFGAVTTAG